MVETETAFYNDGGILASTIMMPYRIVETEDEMIDIAICNTCNKRLEIKGYNNFIGHTLEDCLIIIREILYGK